MWWEGGGVRNWAPHDSEHNVRQPKKESVDVVDRRGFQAGDLPHQAWARATPEEWVGVTRSGSRGVGGCYEACFRCSSSEFGSDRGKPHCLARSSGPGPGGTVRVSKDCQTDYCCFYFILF